MTSPLSLGAAIRSTRKQKAWTAQYLCDVTGLSRITLRELETGLGNPRLSTLLAVCDALDLDILTAPRQVSNLLMQDEPAKPTELASLLKATHRAGLSYQRKKGEK